MVGRWRRIREFVPSLRELGPVVIAAVVVGVVAAPAPQAALSPVPYLDSSYNAALWNAVLDTSWPTGYPADALASSTYIVSARAGTLPSIATAFPVITFGSALFNKNWKLRGAYNPWLWINLNGDVGGSELVANPGRLDVTQGQWVARPASDSACSGVGDPLGCYQLHVPGANSTAGACHTNGDVYSFGVSNGVASSGCTLADTQTNLQNLYNFAAAVPGQWRVVSSPEGGEKIVCPCKGKVIGVSAMAAQVVRHPLALWTSQSFDVESSVLAPSQSVGLAAARSAIGGMSCAVRNEYNAMLDPQNWAGPEPNGGPCGGPISQPTPQTYGPPGGTKVPGLRPLAANPTAALGEPVNMATGSFFTSAVDVSLPGIGVPFTFTRSYNSADSTSGRLGLGWTDSLAWSLSVDGSGNPTVRAGSGQQLHFTLQGGSYVPDPGGRATLTAVSGGYKLVLTDQSAYVFNSSGRLTGESDRNGEGLSLAYDGSGNLASVTDSAGRVITFTTSGGLLTGIALPDGRSVAYAYTSGKLTSFTDLRGNTVGYTYDSGGRLATIVDQNGHTVVSTTYDSASGRVTAQTDPRGHSSSFGWNASTGTATYTDASGHTWTQVYVNNTLRSQQDPLGDTTTYTYDGDLNPTAVTNPRGKTTTMTWGLNGNLATRTAPSPLSYTETWTYNAMNDIAAYTDGRGNTTTYGYDSRGNLTSVTAPDPDGAGPLIAPVTSYGRDSSTGLVTSITDPRGKTTTYAYDSGGDLTSLTTPLGNETTYGYDGSGRMTSMVDARGNVSGANPAAFTWTYTYDAANNRLDQTDPLGNETDWTYDPAGNLASVTDANEHTTSYAYDNANELTTLTAPDTTQTTYAYDNNGNLATKTDANNHTTSYAYDNANRLTGMVKPGGETWTYTYDVDGDLASTVDGNGNATGSGGSTTYGYDNLDRVTSITYSGTVTPNVTFAYDANGNRTQMIDGAGTVTYAYDNDNRFTGSTRGTAAFVFGYDLNSNLATETYPDSTAITYAYTNDEQLASVTSSSQTTSYGYDPAGNLTTTTLPSGNGYAETRSYDNAGRLINISNAAGSTVLSAFAYMLDPVGNPTETDTSGATTATTTYGYDSLDRLTSVCLQASCPNSSDPKTTWAYDNVGNRLTQTNASGTTTSGYNSDDELTAAGSTTYGYDHNGNETAAGSSSFSYDLANRLISASVGSTTTSYGYDGDGNRLTASDGSSTTNFIWDPAASLPQLDLEQDGSHNDLRTYLYGTRLVSMTTGGASPATFYYHYDGLGSVINTTDVSGATQWTYGYDPWGNRTANQSATGAPSNPIQFAGAYNDPTGLDLLGAREYEPNTGRFTTTDPAEAASGSTYAYVDDRPTYQVDPTGLDPGFAMYTTEASAVPCFAAPLLGDCARIQLDKKKPRGGPGKAPTGPKRPPRVIGEGKGGRGGPQFPRRPPGGRNPRGGWPPPPKA